MDEGTDVFAVECSERDGTVVRTVRFAPLTRERLVHYWEKLSQFPTLFNRGLFNFDAFVQTFLSIGEHGIRANGLIWEVDDVGIIWITDIYPEYQATGHFTFWDRQFRGREKIFRELVKRIFEEFQFRRLVIEVPLHSQRVCAFVEKIGFVKEGRLRQAVYYKDQWFDVNLYSILAEEAKWDS